MAHRYASEAPKGSNARGGFVLEVEMVRGIRWMRKTFDWWGGRAAGVRSGAGGKDCFKNKKAARREFGRLLFLGRLEV